MIKQLIAIALLSATSVTHASTSISKESTAETKENIQDIRTSNIYGDWLFKGNFKRNSFSAINPNYILTKGDSVNVQMWGGVTYSAKLTVDARGNIFIPKVGPIKIAGISNNNLNNVIAKNVSKVYKSNIETYVNLETSQYVKIFLSGLVENPGLYEGQSADSILRYLDQAGGVKKKLGSLRNIRVKRNNETIHTIDLYEFIQKGHMPTIQLRDGDVIFVEGKKGEIALEGSLGFEGKYELKNNTGNLHTILEASLIQDKATHITVIDSVFNENQTMKEVSAKQYSLAQIKTSNMSVSTGAKIKVSSQEKSKSISIELLGEHDSEFEIVLPWGSTLQDLLDTVTYNKISNKNAIQLFRHSIAKRQKEMLYASLATLEQNIMTTRSHTTEAANLRQAEASTILQWIEKAKLAEPKGQVLLPTGYNASNIILQQGDQVVIPSKRNIVMIHGEVMFPTAIAYESNMNVEDFIMKSGGSLSDLDNMNILIQKPNGDFLKVSNTNSKSIIQAGDEIFVLAEPDLKEWQMAKDIFQVMYQIAVSAALVVSL